MSTSCCVLFSRLPRNINATMRAHRKDWTEREDEIADFDAQAEGGSFQRSSCVAPCPPPPSQSQRNRWRCSCTFDVTPPFRV